MSFEINDKVKIKYLVPDLKPNREEVKSALRKKNIIKLLKEGIISVKVLNKRKRTMINYISNCDADIIISTRDIFNTWLGEYCPPDKLKIGWEHNHYHGDYNYARNIVRSASHLDYLVLVSDSLRKYYNKEMKNSHCKCVFIPNIIDYIPNSPSPLTSKRIVSVGRLSPEKGYLDLLALGDNTKEEQEEYLLMIKNANERLLGLTNNILLLNKIDNREIVSICPFALDNQIREAVILLESKWKEKNLNINIELDEFLIESNEEMIMSVWTNILSNAIKFTNENGNISIKLVSHGDYAEISIADDGIGIPHDELDNIFNRFYQVDSSHTMEGNGLGLSLVKKILDKVKGSINVYSEIDTGTTFIIKLKKKSY